MPKVSVFIACILVGLAILMAAGVHAQTPGEWTRLGTLPPNTWSILPDPANASILYALGPDGISRSTDAGATWAVCGRGARSMTLAAPEPDVTGTARLYAAMPGGLRASEDGCATWRDVPTSSVLPDGTHVRHVMPYPDNPGVLYAAMDGLGGLYRSVDGGATWQAASRGLPPGGWVTALAADPRRPERVYVGLRYASDDHPPSYLYRSEDGGLTWRSSSLGMHLLPNNGGQVVGLGWSGGTLLAATAHDGLFESTDRGASWRVAIMPRRAEAQPTPLNFGSLRLRPMPLKISAFAANREGALLLNTSEGAYQSLDGGASWLHFGPAEVRGERAILAMERTSGRVLLAGAGSIWGYKMPAGVVALPTATAVTVAEAPPTPPPPAYLPTNTAIPPTATPTPLPTPTVVIAGPLPTDRAQPLDPAVADYFEETGHNVKYGFRDYWKANGGLAAFGYPLTEEFVENGVTVQYFERVRLEYRDGKVQRGLLGKELTEGQFFQTVRFFPSTDDNVYFGPTQHSVSGPFLDFWRDGGGLEAFGYPLSEAFKEQGSEYQWFERARFEWHPYLPQGERIVLGNIGTEALKRRGWIR